jgi:phospholipid transport system substrate-binding protein
MTVWRLRDPGNDAPETLIAQEVRMQAHRLVVALMFALAAAPFQGARAADDPAGYITSLGNQTLTLVQAKDRPQGDRKRQFQQLIDQSFDVPAISRFVLGRYWNTASKDQQQQFTQAFEDYMVGVYWQRFSEYSGETFAVKGRRDEGNGTTIVTTEVAQANGQPSAKVDWSVSKESGGYKIGDVSIEGVSQEVTYRQEFASVIEQNGGVAALIDHLHQKTAG